MRRTPRKLNILLVNLGDQKVHKMVRFCVHQVTATAPRYDAPSLPLAYDNPINEKVVMYLLGKHGHNVAIAGNGREAVETAAKQSFDLFLMDVPMPVMGGIEATAIRRSSR